MKILRLISALTAVLCVVPLLTSCGTARNFDALYDDCFDTVCTLNVSCGDEARFAEISTGFYSLLKELNGLYDIYNDYEKPNLKTVNDNAGSAVKVDERILSLLRFSIDFSEASGKTVTPTMGALTSLWKDAVKEKKPPEKEEIARAMEHIDPSVLILDEKNGTVTLTDPEARIDVGALAKGYAARLLCAYLDGQGVENYLFSLGGNVSAKGVHPVSGELWAAGIRNPDLNSDRISVRSFGMCYESLATSGSYERYFDYDGVRYHHIIDPNTGAPSARTDTVSVSVLHEDPAMTDALSTALFILSEEEGAALLEKLGGSALYIDKDGAIRTYGNFPGQKKESGSRQDIILIVILAVALLALFVWGHNDRKKQKEKIKHPEKAAGTAGKQKTPLGRFAKRDYILLASLLLLAVLLPFLLFFGKTETTCRVSVEIDGKEVFTCDLDKDAVYRAEESGGINVVVIKNGRVWIADADCDGKDCVHTGVIDAHSAIPVIVCLPHRLTVRIVRNG